MAADKPTTVNILSIPKGPVASGPVKINSKEVVSLAEYAATYGAESPGGKYGGFDVVAPPVISDQLDVLTKAHSVYLEILDRDDDDNLDFLTGSPNYEIKTGSGARLFVVSDNSKDLTKCYCHCHGGSPHHEKFDLSMHDSFGRQVLNITGHLGGCAVGACVKVNTGNNNLGTIIQGDCSSPHYIIVNWEGIEVFSIHHGQRGGVWRNLQLETAEPTEFGIYKASEIAKKLFLVGTLFPTSVVDQLTTDVRQAVKLTFPTQCDLPNKLLLLGALFIVDYRIVQREGRQFQIRGNHPCDRFLTVPCLGITFGTLMTVIIIIVLIYELVFHIVTGGPENHPEPKTM